MNTELSSLSKLFEEMNELTETLKGLEISIHLAKPEVKLKGLEARIKQ